MLSLIYYLVVKRLMKTKNSDVEIQNAVMNHESRPLKWNPVLTHIIRMKIQDPFSSSILRRHLEDTCARVSFLINKKKRGPGISVFLWILWNFQEHLFYRTNPWDYFSIACVTQWTLSSLSQYLNGLVNSCKL